MFPGPPRLDTKSALTSTASGLITGAAESVGGAEAGAVAMEVVESQSARAGQPVASVRLMRSEDAAACREIIAASFPAEAERNAAALAELEEEPWYAPSHRLVAEFSPGGARAGLILGQAGIRTGELWIAGHPFPAGCIGTLAVRPEFRRAGVGRLLVEKACEEMRRRGRALAAVVEPFGAGGFLERVGFHRALAIRPAYSLDLKEVPGDLLARAAASVTVRRGEPRDAPVFDQLHFQHYSRLTGGWSRSARFWLRRLTGRPKLWTHPVPEFLLASREKGRALACAAVAKSADRWDVLELACVAGHEQAGAGLVGSIALEAARSGARTLGVDVSHADPAARALAGLGLRGGGRYEPLFLRILDADDVAERAQEVLELRALGEGIAARIELDSSRAMDLGRGGAEVTLRMSLDELLALLFNGAPLEGMRACEVVRLEPDTSVGMALARRLFPETYALRLRVDGY